MGDIPTDTTPGLPFSDLSPDGMIRQSLPFGRLSVAQSLHVLTDAANESARTFSAMGLTIAEANQACADARDVTSEETRRELLAFFESLIAPPKPKRFYWPWSR